jgi:serine acetyltransferase
MTWLDDLRTDLDRSCNRSPVSMVTLVAVRMARTTGPLRWIGIALDRVIVRAILGTEIPSDAEIAPGLGLPHGARGLVVHPSTRIGANCMIFQRVTFAAAEHGAPDLANDVFIGSGACLIGAVRVGAYARIGANAVVVRDVPERGLVYTEATIIPPREDSRVA